MKKLFTLLLIFSTSVIATETITITSPDFDKNDPDWVLVEDDCENPDGFCNQVYVKESEVINYKNKQTKENGLRAVESVQPTKTGTYHKLDNYFDSDSSPDKIHIWVFFSEQIPSESNRESNIVLGNEIITSLSQNTYELEYDSRDLEMGFIPISVNRQALSELYLNGHVLSFDDPTTSTYE